MGSPDNSHLHKLENKNVQDTIGNDIVKFSSSAMIDLLCFELMFTSNGFRYSCYFQLTLEFFSKWSRTFSELRESDKLLKH